VNRHKQVKGKSHVRLFFASSSTTTRLSPCRIVPTVPALGPCSICTVSEMACAGLLHQSTPKDSVMSLVLLEEEPVHLQQKHRMAPLNRFRAVGSFLCAVHRFRGG
jgi:hypothetical protein